ncbi:MAG: formate--tetrahydrofolate ligase [Rhodobiaceae bacterium]|nr:formate--tetrahydrofolate ligase [Rhodobiaceae bacterium]|tara:strand:+ start:94428 stop:96104 length:1677 start_codon:yes stop_codon:yes gene_type:complete
MTTDIEIARLAKPKKISEVANKLGIPEDKLFNYGNYKAKISIDYLDSLNSRSNGKLILITAITPTPAGEGKTTTTVGLGDGLNKLGKKATICIREPSLGPCFGMKGGAAGGGYSQVIPMEDINLHFTGDFHAIGIAHNLLCAMVDNHIYWGNSLNIDTRRISIRRALDMNERSLREIVSSLGGVANGYPRSDGFDITVASEVMAIFCLSSSLSELTERLGRIVVGYTRERDPITASMISANDAMAVLLKDALMPNIVQTLEGSPALVHGGPFANIAHGCNSIIATKAALKLSDYVVTEAGFGADLGAEKFFNIKCRQLDTKPSVAVVVATVRALKMHGGIEKDQLSKENIDAVRLGCSNLIQHIENISKFGVPVVVCVNKFTKDTDNEIAEIGKVLLENGVDSKVILSNHWAKGGEGILDLSNEIIEICSKEQLDFKFLYDKENSIMDKISVISKEIYRANNVHFSKKSLTQIKDMEKNGFSSLPICMAKTQYSFSTDPTVKNNPQEHDIEIKELRLSAGAGFIVAISGDIMTMPGLPRVPAAEKIYLDDQGKVEGLF